MGDWVAKVRNIFYYCNIVALINYETKKHTYQRSGIGFVIPER